ncbi:glucosamine-6-phosphate deaminase [Nibrella saemangeumensis]|uniref:Glucosamine-6-phosphate deaminase n=1 Tax=Nibrella saemangeumensis TaxID=1084526 RepID=A0ABP8MLP3_9BACT
MQVQTFASYEDLSQHTAEHIANRVRQKPTATLCLASGETPISTFHHLVTLAQTGQVDFSQCTFIGLDEWVGFGPEDEGSCAYYLFRDLFGPLNINPNQIHYFNAKSIDLPAECLRTDAAIAERGGLDLILVGIGMNGHIALNEPGTSFNLYAHVSELAEVTVQVGQKYFTQATPLSKGITLGLRHLMEAREVILMASGSRKAAVIRHALQGPVTEDLPASIIQQHPSAHVWLDAEAGTQL